MSIQSTWVDMAIEDSLPLVINNIPPAIDQPTTILQTVNNFSPVSFEFQLKWKAFPASESLRSITSLRRELGVILLLK